jgi:hypothetical protein
MDRPEDSRDRVLAARRAEWCQRVDALSRTPLTPASRDAISREMREIDELYVPRSLGVFQPLADTVLTLSGEKTDQDRVRALAPIREWLLASGADTAVLEPSESAEQSEDTALPDSDPETIFRHAIVKKNIALSYSGICQLFDEAKISLPPSMQEAGSWKNAYKSIVHRHAIESLITRDRKFAKG